MLGLFTFFYVVLHFLAYAWLDMGFDPQAIARDIPKRPFALVGFTAFLLLLLPLAAPSVQPRDQGARRGALAEALHRLVYLIAGLALLHFFWMRAAKNNFAEVAVYAAVLGVLLEWRSAAGACAARERAPPPRAERTPALRRRAVHFAAGRPARRPGARGRASAGASAPGVGLGARGAAPLPGVGWPRGGGAHGPFGRRLIHPAASATSRRWSLITTTLWPPSTRRCSTRISFSTSAMCRPTVGSSSTYSGAAASGRARRHVVAHLGELGDQLDALRLAAGQRGRRLAQREVAQAHVLQQLQRVRDRRHAGEELDRLVDLHLQHVADALAAPA